MTLLKMLQKLKEEKLPEHTAFEGLEQKYLSSEKAREELEQRLNKITLECVESLDNFNRLERLYTDLTERFEKERADAKEAMDNAGKIIGGLEKQKKYADDRIRGLSEKLERFDEFDRHTLNEEKHAEMHTHSDLYAENRGLQKREASEGSLKGKPTDTGEVRNNAEGLKARIYELYEKSVQFYRADKDKDALEVINEAINLDPNYPTSHENLGVILRRMSKFGEAEKCYMKAISLGNDNAENRRHLGFCLYMQDKIGEAEREFKHSIGLDPDYDSPHFFLAKIYSSQNKFREAEREYKESIRLDPSDDSSHNNLGYIYSSQGRYKEAEIEYKEAIRLDPSSGVSHNNLAHLYSSQGRYKEAEIEYMKAIEVEPSYVTARENLEILRENMRG